VDHKRSKPLCSDGHNRWLYVCPKGKYVLIDGKRIYGVIMRLQDETEVFVSHEEHSASDKNKT
jgi:hypothetical protein